MTEHTNVSEAGDILDNAVPGFGGARTQGDILDNAVPVSDEIKTGDTVLHVPSDEEWIVAFVDGLMIWWVGWPPGRALLKDCRLIQKATPEQRNQLIKELAAVKDDDPRFNWARRQVEPRVEDPVVTVRVSLSALRALVGEVKADEFIRTARPFKLVRSTVVKATWPLAPKTMWTLEAL